jgi:prepilin-type N-terminal cleavage/methylation domain-containing protein
MNKFARKFGREFGAKKGFSLIEMLIAMAIFVLFTGVILTSYLGIVKALRNAEDYRILYSEARHVFDVITDTARNYKIDYGSGAFVNPVKNITFLSLDGGEKVSFVYNEGAGLEMTETKCEACPGEKVALYSEIKIKNFSFYVWPINDPFSYKNFEITNNFQPKVTFSAIFEKETATGQKYEMKLQTSVSLRNYN